MLIYLCPEYPKFVSMETTIRVRPSELNEKLLAKIKEFIGNKDVDITISVREFDPSFTEDLRRSEEEAKDGNKLISFTMEEFVNYHPAKKK